MARRVERRLRAGGASGGIEFDSAAFTLTFTHQGSQRTINLHNLFTDYVGAWPWRRSRLIRHFLSTLLQALASDIPASWEEAAAHVLPAVRHRFHFEAERLVALAAGQEPSAYALFELLPGCLLTCTAYDAERSITLLSADCQRGWGVPLDQVLARAVANLAALSEPRWTSPSPGVYVSAWQGDYDCSRILVDQALRGLEIDGDMVALLPDRNCLIVTGLGNPDALGAALTLAAQRSNPRLISSVPLLRSAPAWQTLDLASDHPCHPLWRQLCLQEEGEVYRQQKDLLEQLFARQQRDISVASFMLDSGTGRLRSYTSWTKGVVSLLPATDLIDMVDHSLPEGEQFLGRFEHAAIEQRCGHLLLPTDHFPARLHVDGFPTAEELRALRSSSALPFP